MKNAELLIEAMKTLLFSWGGDTPSEAVWGVNGLLDFYEAETGISIGYRYNENWEETDVVRDGVTYTNDFEKIEEILMYHRFEEPE